MPRYRLPSYYRDPREPYLPPGLHPDTPVRDEYGNVVSGFDPGMGYVNPAEPWSQGDITDYVPRWAIEGEQPTADDLLGPWGMLRQPPPDIGETPEQYWQREIVPDAIPASLRRQRREPRPLPTPTGDADRGIGGPPPAPELPPMLPPGLLTEERSGAVPGMQRSRNIQPEIPPGTSPAAARLLQLQGGVERTGTPAGGESLGDPMTPLKIAGAQVAGGIGAGLAGAGGIAGFGGRAVLPYLATEVGMEELESAGIPARQFSEDVGTVLAGGASAALQSSVNPTIAFEVGRRAQEVGAEAALREAYDKYSIPVVSGALQAMLRPENAVPGIGFVDFADLARMADDAARGAAKGGAAAARAANEALPDTLRLTGGSRAAQAGEVINPANLGKAADDVVPIKPPDIGGDLPEAIPGNPPAPAKPRYRISFDENGHQVIKKVDDDLTVEELHRIQDAGKLPPNDGTPDGIRAALDEVERPTAFTEHIARGERPLSGEVQQSLAQQTETYLVQSNAKSLAAADALIANDREAARMMVLDPSGPPDAVRTAAAIRLMAEADRAGNVAEVNTIARAVAQRLRAQGQEIQMAGKWDNISPERVLATANIMLQDAVAKHGGEKIAKRLRQLDDAANKRLAGEAAERIKMAADNDMLKAKRTAKELTAKADALEKRPVTAKSLIDEILGLWGDKPGANKSVGAMAADQAEAFRARARYIKDMPDGPEREAAKRDLLREIQAGEKPRYRVTADAAGNPVVLPADEAAKLDAARKRVVSQDAKNRARDLEYFMDETARDSTRVTNADRQAVAQAKTVLKKYGAELDEATSNGWLDRAREIRGQHGDEAALSRKELIDEIKSFNPVAEKIAQRQRDMAEARFLRQQARDLLYFTEESSRLAKKKADNIARQTITSAKQSLKQSGVELPESVARTFLADAHNLSNMPANTPLEKLARGREATRLLDDLAKLAPASKWFKFLDILREVTALPRAIAASFDMSWLLRQGMMSWGHPKEYAVAGRDMLKAFLSDDVADAVDAEFLYGQFGKVHKQAGLAHVNRFGRPGAVEEGFLSRWLEKVPGVGKVYAGTERAFTTAGNKYRMDVFDNTVRGWLPEAMRNQQFDSIEELIQATGKSHADFTELGRFLSAVTGRSENKWLTSASPVLSPLFWAPRYAFSRFEAPSMMLITSSNAVRKMAIKDMAAYVAAVATPLVAIKAGGGEVELDPRSNDFGKGQWQGVKFDFSAGEAMNIRVLAQMMTGQQKLATGRLADKPREEALGDYLRNKLAPAPAVGADIMTGSDAIGRSVKTGLEIAKDVASKFLPISPVEMVEAFQTVSPVAAGVASGLTLFGVGVSTPPPGIRQAYDTAAQRVHDKPAKELTPREYGLLRDEPEIQAAEADLQSRVGEPLERKLRGAREDYQKAVLASEQELLKIIQSGARGEVLRDAIQRHSQNRSQSFKALFPPELQEYSKRGVELSLNEQWRDAYQDVPMPLKSDGSPDFRAWDNARADVLRRAIEAGASEKHVTEKGYVARTKELRPYLDAYDAARETLRSYWEIEDSFYEQFPDFRQAQGLLEDAAKDKSIPGQLRLAELRKALQPVTSVANKVLDQLKTDYRLRHSDADSALVEWYGHTPVVSKIINRSR